MQTGWPVRSWAPPLRAATVSLVTLAATLTGSWLSARLLLDAIGTLQAPGPARFEDAITVGAAGATILLLAWLGLAVTLTAGAVARRRRRAGLLQAASRRIAPAALRRTVAALVGATVVGLSAPALAQADTGLDPGWPSARPAAVAQLAHGSAPPVPAAGSRTGGPTRLTAAGSTVEATWAAEQARAQAPGLDPGWVPERPPPAPRTITPLPAAPGRSGLLVDEEVVVHRGDTLWDIAARRLGPAASDALVAAEWPRWYAANRAVIGADPDQLQPGQRLRPPDSAVRPTIEQRSDQRNDQERTVGR